MCHYDNSDKKYWTIKQLDKLSKNQFGQTDNENDDYWFSVDDIAEDQDNDTNNCNEEEENADEDSNNNPVEVISSRFQRSNQKAVRMA
eukprot:11430205-Ditylum_brightwellii.AAC.1